MILRGALDHHVVSYRMERAGDRYGRSPLGRGCLFPVKTNLVDNFGRL